MFKGKEDNKDKDGKDGKEETPTYTLHLTATCKDESARLTLDKEILSIAHALEVDRHTIEKGGFENEVELTWEGPVTHLAALRSKLDKIAKASGVCFDITLETDHDNPTTHFVGVNADHHEVDYLLDQLENLGPRLVRRSDMIAARCGLDVVKIKSIFEVLRQIPERDQKRQQNEDTYDSVEESVDESTENTDEPNEKK